MLEVTGLDISYEATHAVRGIDVTAAADEVVCLLGPNGAGKTSVLRAVTNLIGFGGRVLFDGEDIAGVARSELARRGLIHVPEGRHVFPTLSVHENLRMGEVARGRRQARYSLDDMYDLFPALTKLRRRSGFALSGGEQQMVALARAFVASPRLLLLDEPSLGLAPAVVAAVYDAVAEIASSTPVLLVEQNTTEALAVADRGYVLSGGQIVMSGSAADLSDRSAVLANYLGQSDVESHKKE